MKNVMTLAEFDRQMAEAHAKMLAMPRTTSWEEHLYQGARMDIIFADTHIREDIKAREAQRHDK